MPDDNDFPLDADNFSDEVEIEFIDPEDADASADAKGQQPADDGGVEPVIIGEAGDEAETLRAELDHVRDVYLRKLAEFDNFRKRVEREREESRRGGAEDMIAEILPVIDNFDRALHHAEDDSGAFREGVEMISKQLYDILDRRGVVEINPLGQPFDPERHEAVQRVEDSGYEPGTVAFVMLKGYSVGDKLMRPALVGVAVDPAGDGGNGVAS
jgi:molecular chaperone GrpE